MDKITQLAHNNGAVALVYGHEVWATASGEMVKKLMIAAAKAERDALHGRHELHGRRLQGDLPADIRPRPRLCKDGWTILLAKRQGGGACAHKEKGD